MKSLPLDKVAGTPRSFEVAGTTYLMSQVTVNILARVEQWAREQPFERLRMKLEKLGDKLPDSIIEKWCDEATAKSESMENVQTELESVTGVRKILRLCFDAMQPITDEEFDSIIDFVGLDILKDFLDSDNSVPGIDDQKAPEGTKKK